MLTYFRKLLRLLFIGILVVIIIYGQVRFNILRIAATPVFKLVNITFHGSKSFSDYTKLFFHTYREIREQEKELLEIKKKYLEERMTEYEYKALQKENSRLRKTLRLKSKRLSKYNLVAAEVIGFPPKNYFFGLIINKGRDDGIREHMPVITEEGLIGKIVTVYSNRSVIQLITDPHSRISVLTATTRHTGLLQGQGFKHLTVEYVNDANNEIRPNDLLITSGYSENFPKGIKVAQITKIRKKTNRLFSDIEARPLVVFKKLEEIFVIR
ncbi:rod shape-determining protein MreC [Candidatus Margulisiibacteriota bacterium]